MWVQNDQQNITRRGIVLGLLMFLPFPAFWLRLFFLQNISGQKYRRLAENNRVNLRPLQPHRGLMLDRDGKKIAYDVRSFHLVMIKEQTDGRAEETLNKISKLTGLSARRKHNILREMSQKAAFTPVTVFKNLPFEDLSKVQVNLPYLPGVDLLPVVRRNYPHGVVMGHVLGYTGVPSDHEKETLNLPESWPDDFAIGRKGVEKTLDQVLRGDVGIKEVEVNAHGRELREISRIPPRNGMDVHLSIDLELQQVAWDALKGRVGSAVVLDVETGEIIVAASRPAYDVNDFVDGISTDKWDKLRLDEGRPLVYRAFNGIYAPGSTFKPLIAAAALNEGVGVEGEEIRCTGKMRFGIRDFHCWKRHGTLNMREAISQSCDIYFYELGKRLGIDKISRYAHMFGLGDRYDTLLPESIGLVPSKEWKLRVKKERWARGEDLITAIGQGFLLASPLQLAVMTARIATGKKVIPVLMKQTEKTHFDKIEMDEKAWEVMRGGMYDVINDYRGTAKRARGRGFFVAGKTGTSQVVSRRIEEGVEMVDVPYKERPHGLFVSYAPFDNPRYATAVVIEHGGSGSGAAAPVSAKIMNAVMKKT